MQKPVILAAAVCLALAACGEDNADTAAEACPAVEGDRHVSQDRSEPGALPMMLHVSGRACSKTGENTFVLYPVNEADGGLHGHAFTTADVTGTHGDVRIESVKATMPSMGHGTAEPAKLINDDTFSVAFQMPGEWSVEVEFSTSATDASQTVVFPLTVK